MSTKKKPFENFSITELEFKFRYFELLYKYRKKFQKEGYSISIINASIIQELKSENLSVIMDEIYSTPNPNQFSLPGSYLVDPFSALVKLEDSNKLFITEEDIDAANMLGMFSTGNYTDALREIVYLSKFTDEKFGFKSSVKQLFELEE